MQNCFCCSGPVKKAGRFSNRRGVVQRFQCIQCNKTYSEPQPLDGLRISDDKVAQIAKLLTEGLGIRAVARFLNCDPHTVLNTLDVLGAKCDALHDRLVQNVQTDSIQIDEIWSRVGVSQRRLVESGKDPELFGDQYTFLAVAAREKFIISHVTGKRNAENTERFVADFARRITGRIQITSDSWQAYPELVRKYLLGRLDYATMQKLFGEDHNGGADGGQRYSPGKCTGFKIKVRAGSPRSDRINTSFVERANLTVRHFNKRFTRLGLGYSRKFTNHCRAISLFVAAYNFCKVHSTLGCTPAVGLGLATEKWTLEKLIHEATTKTNSP